jgi:hypothetical protein
MMGSQETQVRNGSNLSRLDAELSSEEKQEAMCYTMAYVIDYAKSRGTLTEAAPKDLPHEKVRRIKDMSWWLDSERKNMGFACPAPWNAAANNDEAPAPTSKKSAR